MKPAAPVTRTFIRRVHSRRRQRRKAPNSGVAYDKFPLNSPKTVLDCRKRPPIPCAAFALAHVRTMIIKAYLKPSCGWSNGVRAILRKYNLEYEDIDIINHRANYAE